MSWRERPYNNDSEQSQYQSPAGGEAKSWFGGGLRKPGPAVKWIIIANVLVFFLCAFTGRMFSPIIDWFSLQTSAVLQRFQIWRLLTYSYLHDQIRIEHILFNMIVLYYFGAILEARWGSLKLFVFYTIGSIAACAIYVPLTLMSALPWFGYLIGASGGVLALIGACAALMPDMQMFFGIPIRPFCVILVIIYAWAAFMNNDGGDACHLAGLGFGVLFGYRGQKWFKLMDNWQTRRAQAKWEAQRQSAVRLEQDVDRILEKVRSEGIQSLSRREKQTLEAATKSKQHSGHSRHH